MRIILSRKGFDSSRQGGGNANIIYNNRPYMIPIPEVDTGIKYKDLMFEDESLLKVMRDLNIHQFTECHLDPYLDSSIVPEEIKKNWKYNLGQVDTAQSALSNKESTVKEGDLFLFFGWFQQVEKKNDKYRYVQLPNYPKEGIHLIYGYLQIGEIIHINEIKELPSWTKNHPHVLQQNYYKHNNVIYVAGDNLTGTHLPGAGMLNFHEDLILTRKGTQTNSKNERTYYTRTEWELPDTFLGSRIKYLNAGKAITEKHIKAASRGQEFVVLEDPNQQIEKWALEMIPKNYN